MQTLEKVKTKQYTISIF